MNFLAHYYLLEDKINSKKVFGNLLPDLVRGFSKIYQTELKQVQDKNNAILQGINFHLKTDKIFHNHDFFTIQNEKIKKLIIKHKVPTKRYYISTHILLELLIDQYLIKQNQTIANDFYNILEKDNNLNLIREINLLTNNKINSKLFIIFKSFIENKYAYQLNDNLGIKFALNEIIGKKIGIDYKKNNWEKVINESYNDLAKELPQFLNKINIELQNA